MIVYTSASGYLLQFSSTVDGMADAGAKASPEAPQDVVFELQREEELRFGVSHDEKVTFRVRLIYHLY